MEAYITLVAGMFLMPCIYWGTMTLCQPAFQEEKNRNRKPLHSVQEIAVMIAAEAALVRIWQSRGKCTALDMTFELLFVMLAAMTFFCMTDYWEKIVPNRMLLVLLCLSVLIMGMQGVRNMDVLLETLPSMILGLIFCVVSFGIGYLLARGSMGAGDVKLAFVMGWYLTGEYVVGAILYGCIISALYSIIQLVRGKLSRKDQIPFVPFLYIGVIIRYLIG